MPRRYGDSGQNILAGSTHNEIKRALLQLNLVWKVALGCNIYMGGTDSHPYPVAM